MKVRTAIDTSGTANHYFCRKLCTRNSRCKAWSTDNAGNCRISANEYDFVRSSVYAAYAAMRSCSRPTETSFFTSYKDFVIVP